MPHTKNLPEQFAVAIATEQEYQAVKNWLLDAGYKAASNFNSTPTMTISNCGIYVIGLTNASFGAHAENSINNYSAAEWLAHSVPVMLFSDWATIAGIGLAANKTATEGSQPVRKITGYKLLKDYPLIDPDLKKQRELIVFKWYEDGSPEAVMIKGHERKIAGGPKHFGTINVTSYPEFWEPIYGSEFKVGDWCTYFTLDQQSRTSVVAKVTGKMIKMENGAAMEVYDDSANLRHATPKEIDEASKTILILGSGKARRFEIQRDIIAVYKCDNGTTLQIQPNAVRDILLGYMIEGMPAEITGIKLEGSMFTHGDIKKIWEAYKKHTPDWNTK